MNVMAADVGGTKSWFMCADSEAPDKVLFEKRYLCNQFDAFEPMFKNFLDDSGINTEQPSTLTLALPGLVNDDTARLTNLPWLIEKQKLKQRFTIDHVYFMNDFQASALGVSRLQPEETIILNTGNTSINCTANNSIRVAVGAGTGLGLAWVEPDEIANDISSSATSFHTEGGHIDFAPVNETQIRLLKFLQRIYSHVSYERILSGDGLTALYQFCSFDSGDTTHTDTIITAEWVNQQAEFNELANQALSLFTEIYGAYIGNIALLFKPGGGIYITGGIAAKILHRMQSEEFINAYLNKGRMRGLVEQIAVYLVTNERVGVYGAMAEAIKHSRYQHD